MKLREFARAFSRLPKKTRRSAAKLDADLTAEVDRLAKKRGTHFHEVVWILLHGEPPPCPTCGDRPNFNRYDRGFFTYCCNSCMGVAKEADKRATSLRKRGVDHHWQDPKVKAKIRATLRRNHGVSFPGQVEAGKLKRVETNMARYGAESPMQVRKIRARVERTMLERYGVDNPLKVPEIKSQAFATRKRRHEKGLYVESYARAAIASRRTCLRRYGVDHPMKHPTTLRKMLRSSYSRKSCVIDGRRFAYMGYEHHALRYLADYFGVDALNNARVPAVPVSGCGSYLADVLVDDRILVEVKSPHTAGLQTSAKDRRFDLLLKKAAAARAAGFDFWCLVFNGNGDLLLKTRLVKPDRVHYRKLMIERNGRVGGAVRY